MPETGASCALLLCGDSAADHTFTQLADFIRLRLIDPAGDASSPATQALLVLAHLFNSDTYACLAANSLRPRPTRRCVREPVDLLTAPADDVNAVGRRALRPAYPVFDGTLVTLDRVHDQKPVLLGQHRRHGVNVQVLADPAD